LYYCRSLSIQRADNVSEMLKESARSPELAPLDDMAPLRLVARAVSVANYEECLACQ
jgi:ribonucleoside-diphosphate reductase alpha chain